jgi:hypothetical protein
MRPLATWIRNPLDPEPAKTTIELPVWPALLETPGRYPTGESSAPVSCA